MRGLWTLSNGGGITDLVLAVPKAELALVDAEIDDGGYTFGDDIIAGVMLLQRN